MSLSRSNDTYTALVKLTTNNLIRTRTWKEEMVGLILQWAVGMPPRASSSSRWSARGGKTVHPSGKNINLSEYETDTHGICTNEKCSVRSFSGVKTSVVYYFLFWQRKRLKKKTNKKNNKNQIMTAFCDYSLLTFCWACSNTGTQVLNWRDQNLHKNWKKTPNINRYCNTSSHHQKCYLSYTSSSSIQK